MLPWAPKEKLKYGSLPWVDTNTHTHARMLPNMPAAILQACDNPFVGDWDIEQGSQLKLKIGGHRSHYYFLFRDRRTGRIILQAGRRLNDQRFFVMDPQTSMYELFLLNHVDHQYEAGAEDALLVMSVGRQFNEGRHGSIDVVVP